MGIGPSGGFWSARGIPYVGMTPLPPPGPYNPSWSDRLDLINGNGICSTLGVDDSATANDSFQLRKIDHHDSEPTRTGDPLLDQTLIIS
jgi:hypothetical protein